MDIIKKLSEELNIRIEQVEKTVSLLDVGNTIPFIARYRKEVTGALDDSILRTLNDRLVYLRHLESRREEVYAAVLAMEKMTDEISAALSAASTLTEIEDIYRPFRPHRRTRASVARESGLEPLAELLLRQEERYIPSLEEQAAEFTDPDKGVNGVEDAISGACDIIAEDISDNAVYRKKIRTETWRNATIVTKGIKNETSPYEMYYDYSEKMSGMPNHRILAINRAEKEEYIRVDLVIDESIVLDYLKKEIIIGKSAAEPYLIKTISDSYERLIAPSIERELRAEQFDTASEGAIKNFSENLRNLLMQPPIKGHTVLGLDPGYRTGCKLAVVDKTGKVLDTAVIYPTKPHERIEEARKKVISLIRKYNVTIVAIGNGTASKESEIFIAETLHEIDGNCKYIMVSEAGASVYSASKLGAEEFPDFDVTQRSAVSIARRLQDPLAELVKIDPESIGVGQYQHDMKQSRLSEALNGVVEYCVNTVGVDVNTASYSLLSHISGINATSAKNIVKYREENGEFTSRAQILKVPRIGAKAYEQCAGFLRVSGSDEILDNTGVHPESYDAARKLLLKFGTDEDDVRRGNIRQLRSSAESYGVEKLARELEIGAPTLNDIIEELEKPGRDVRDDFPSPVLREDVMDMNDLTPGMELTGTVRNVIDFGAFVDIGVHQDGLVHISQICEKYIKHPSEVLAVGDSVKVKVLSVDTARGRISLSMKL